MTTDRRLIWTVSLWGFVFVLSLALYLLVPGSLTRTTLKFPQEITKALVPEVRSLPFNWDREHNVELVVREVLLGPARHDHLRLFSRDAKVRNVLVREGNIYIDLAKEAFNPDADVIYSPMTALGVLKTTLMDNFPGVANVWISVEGDPGRPIVVDKG
jgi:spore germination protein GerM